MLVYRDWPVEKLKEVKVADALKHPNWNMGKKITVDSATLFNKVKIICFLKLILAFDQGVRCELLETRVLRSLKLIICLGLSMTI